MIHEIRTYDLLPRMVPEYERRFGEKLPGRLGFSPLGGLWHTEVGPLNQIVAIWPYDSLEHRGETRRKAGDAGVWPPDSGDLIARSVSEIFTPAPSMTPLGDRDMGPIYEMRLHTYPPEDVPLVLDSWEDYVPAREELSPMAGCWYRESGGRYNFVHMWAYRSFDERLRIRADAIERGLWPPKNSATLIEQQTKVLLPSSHSPMQ